MPALTHNRVKNGFNGYATRVRLPTGGLSNTQPLKFNGGTPPKRNFEAKYNAQVNRPHALPSTIGVSTPTQRANALRAFNGSTGPNCKECLPKQTFSKPVQSSGKRKVPLVYAKGKPRRSNWVTSNLTFNLSLVKDFSTLFTLLGVNNGVLIAGGCDCDVGVDLCVCGETNPPNILPSNSYIGVGPDVTGLFTLNIAGYASASTVSIDIFGAPGTGPNGGAPFAVSSSYNSVTNRSIISGTIPVAPLILSVANIYVITFTL